MSSSPVSESLPLFNPLLFLLPLVAVEEDVDVAAFVWRGSVFFFVLFFLTWSNFFLCPFRWYSFLSAFAFSDWLFNSNARTNLLANFLLVLSSCTQHEWSKEGKETKNGWLCELLSTCSRHFILCLPSTIFRNLHMLFHNFQFENKHHLAISIIEGHRKSPTWLISRTTGLHDRVCLEGERGNEKIQVRISCTRTRPSKKNVTLRCIRFRHFLKQITITINIGFTD